MPLSAYELIGFLLGLLLGSFLNVCIARIPQGESIVRPGSHCPRCMHPIRWYDNLPILSWLLLRARCRDCGAKISWQYPAVELAAGLWGALAGLRLYDAWWTHGFITTMRPLSYALFFSVDALSVTLLGLFLIPLIVIDWRLHRLPDAFTLTGIATGLFLVCTQAIFLAPNEADITLSTTHKLRMSSPGSMADQGNMFLTGPEHLMFGRLLAVSAIIVLLLTIRATYKAVRHRDGLGLGDVKMLAMIAAFLGFWPTILTLFLATLLATLYALPLVLTRRATRLTRLPFGSFLGAAGLITSLTAAPILTWYTNLLR